MANAIEDVLEGKATRIVYSSDKELIVECLKTQASAVVEAVFPEGWDWYYTHGTNDPKTCSVAFRHIPKPRTV